MCPEQSHTRIVYIWYKYFLQIMIHQCINFIIASKTIKYFTGVQTTHISQHTADKHSTLLQAIWRTFFP